MENKEKKVKRTIEEGRYYNRGVIEGYLAVDLEILTNVPANLVEAFEAGKEAGILKRDKIMNKEDFNALEFQEKRAGYIETMGLLVATESYPASSESLSIEDKYSFEKGYDEGLRLVAEQNTSADDYLENKRRSLRS